MKTYWPIFFIFTMALFHLYVSLWNMRQNTSIASSKKSSSAPITINPSPPPNICLSTFYYPHAKITENKKTIALFESMDIPSRILQWYKEKLFAENFTTVSSIADTTNGASSYMLVSQKDTSQMTIIIGKGQQDVPSIIFIYSVLCN